LKQNNNRFARALKCLDHDLSLRFGFNLYGPNYKSKQLAIFNCQFCDSFMHSQKNSKSLNFLFSNTQNNGNFDGVDLQSECVQSSSSNGNDLLPNPSGRSKSLRACVCEAMYVCMCVFMFEVNVSSCLCACLYVCTCVHAYKCMNVCTHAHMKIQNIITS